jgi:hypothetical protein
MTRLFTNDGVLAGFSQSVGTSAEVTSPVHTGAKALDVSGGDVLGSADLGIPLGRGAYARTYYKPTTVGTLHRMFFFNSASGIVAEMDMDTDGSVRVGGPGFAVLYTGSPGIFQAGVWNKLELFIKVAAVPTTTNGQITVKVNGTTVLTSTAVNLGTARPASICVGTQFSSPTVAYIDNTAVNDDQGAAPNNTWPEAIQVVGAALAGAGSVGAAGVRSRLGVAAVAGAGAVGAAGVRSRFGGAVLLGQGDVAGAGVRTRTGGAAVAGAGAVGANGFNTEQDGANVAGTGSLGGTGLRITHGAAAVAGGGALAADGRADHAGAVGLTGTGQVGAGAGLRKVPGGAALVGLGTMTAKGALLLTGTVQVAGAGALVATGEARLRWTYDRVDGVDYDVPPDSSYGRVDGDDYSTDQEATYAQ